MSLKSLFEKMGDFQEFMRQVTSLQFWKEFFLSCVFAGLMGAALLIIIVLFIDFLVMMGI